MLESDNEESIENNDERLTEEREGRKRERERESAQEREREKRERERERREMVGVGGQLLVQRTPVRARSRVTVRRTRLASPTTSNARSRADNNTRNNRRREKSTRLHAASSKNLSGRGERGEEPSGRRLLELRSSQSTSEIETSTTLTTRIKALLESWFKIISSAFSSFSVKQALFNVSSFFSFFIFASHSSSLVSRSIVPSETKTLFFFYLQGGC